MMNGRLKKIITVSLAAVLALSLTANGAYAGSKKKMLEAFEDIQIEYNGTTLSDTDGPLLINNKTYIPLRMLMTYFGDKEISWDNTNRKVKVNSKQNQSDTMYQSQIASRNAQIAELEKQVQGLKAQLAAAKNTTDSETSDSLNLTKLKKSLNDDYEDYDSKDISIALSGDKSKIKLTVTMSSKDWNDFSASEKTKFLDKVCGDIWDDVSKATIAGTIKSDTKTLDSFSVKPGKDVSLEDSEDADELNLTKLKKSLNDDYKDYNNKDISIALSGDSSKIKLTVTISSTDWNALSASEKTKFLNKVCGDIWDDVSKATITGTIKNDTKTLDSFTVKAGKDVSFESSDSDTDLDSLKSALVKKFKEDWKDEDLTLSLAISGTSTKITYKATLDMGTYSKEWKALSATKKKNLMDDLYSEIEDEYGKATITGYVYDSKSKENIAKYDGSKLTE